MRHEQVLRYARTNSRSIASRDSRVGTADRSARARSRPSRTHLAQLEHLARDAAPLPCFWCNVRGALPIQGARSNDLFGSDPRV